MAPATASNTPPADGPSASCIKQPRVGGFRRIPFPGDLSMLETPLTAIALVAGLGAGQIAGAECNKGLPTFECLSVLGNGQIAPPCEA